MYQRPLQAVIIERIALCMVVEPETATRQLIQPRTPKRRAFFLNVSKMMEIEKTHPATMSDKRFIEVGPLTARGFDALNELDDAFEVFEKWLSEVWEDGNKVSDFIKRSLTLYDWCRDEVFSQVKGVYGATRGKMI